jgi:hypothetical protein
MMVMISFNMTTGELDYETQPARLGTGPYLSPIGDTTFANKMQASITGYVSLCTGAINHFLGELNASPRPVIDH